MPGIAQWIVLIAAPALAAQTAETIRIARIRAKAQVNLSGLPNYTCTQTIERSQRRAKTRRFQLVDTIRLEVALVGGKELFAWPGQAKFDDRELREMVGGTIGNGNFALHARSVFLSSAPTYEYEGEREVDGRKLYRYHYRVPRFRSSYLLRSGKMEGVAGYHGTFDADAATLDLVRLEVVAEDIPPHLPIAAARDEMYYARVPIGGGDYLLPQSSVLTLTDLDGTESRNRVTFAGCRQYGIESTIRFDDPPPGEAAPPPPAVEVDLPEGLMLETTLETAVSLQPPVIGAPFEARLVRDAKVKGKTWVPRGAVARGRILSQQRFYQRMETLVLRLELADLEFPGAHAEIRALPEEIFAMAAASGRAGVGKQGIIYVYGPRRDLATGTRITWRVVAKNKEEGRQTQ